MLPRFCSQTITVARAPLIDDRGAQIRDWSNATSHDITGCSVQPASTSLGTSDAREPVNILHTAYLPPAADIALGDKITFDGSDYALNGAPQHVESPTGAVSHTVINLIRWVG